jgi:hypothetical protein
MQYYAMFLDALLHNILQKAKNKKVCNKLVLRVWLWIPFFQLRGADMKEVQL